MMLTREYFGKRIEGNRIYVGIDVHKETWAVCLVDGFGGKIKSFSQSASPVQLLRTLEPALRDGLDVICTYEAGYFGFEPCRILIEGGCKCTVTAPSLIPVQIGNRVKTDSKDCHKLAICLAAGMLTPVWVPSRRLEYHRSLIRFRTQIQADRVRIMTRIRARLSQHGLVAPAGKSWSAKFMHQLVAVSSKIYELDLIQKTDLETLENFNKHIKKITGEIIALLKLPDYCAAANGLLTIPGVGPLTTMKILLEIGDFSRFSKKGRIEAYCGLTPSQFSSGEKVRMGHITRCGRSSVRTTLVEAAWLLVRSDPAYHQFYSNLKAKRGGKRAIVAVARRLVGIMRRIVLDGQNFKPRELTA